VPGLRSLALLGSTGSIGRQAVDVVLRNADRFRVVALGASGRRPDLLAEQAARLGVDVVAVARPDAEDAVRSALGRAGADGVRVKVGEKAVVEVAGCGADVVLNGLDGAAGLEPTLAALDAGSRLALANKESLIIGGPLVTRTAGPGQIVPVDSEHSAIAQCLRSGSAAEVDRLVLTASGGPFRGRPREHLLEVTPTQALNHPTWSMGPLVTINSATLVNKGLEVVEAHLLFGVPLDRVDVWVHPQSIVHSMVQFRDGSTIAQCSPPDMRLPIAFALGWPDRVPDAAPALRLDAATSWTFEPLDDAAFPAVRLARKVGELGATYPAVYNASNEESVAAFLAGRIGFLDIVDTVERVVADHVAQPDPDLAGVLAADAWARDRARELLSAPVRLQSVDSAGKGTA
jgi:1-deoxy-D-xylulose-5-phosphate reductoisomerase